MKISKRQKVEVRDIWSKETEFSTWLASAEGLELIASDIGIEVENTHTESSPGDFSCDIVGNALGDESHRIVIENQYNKTNHDHLGKMLTYAAVHDATTGIWISERISDDHRQVIDWLNSITPSSVNFYLAQIKAYRIDDSAVAPELDVICRHSAVVKPPPPTESWNKEFWEDILSYIKGHNPPFNVQSPSAYSWASIATGRSSFWIGLVFETRQPYIRCELCFNPSWRFSAFEQLKAQQEEIEREIGNSLEWLPDNKISRIRLKTDMNVKDDTQRDAIKAWMNTQINAFYRAFRPRIANLDADYEIENTEAYSIESQTTPQVLAP